MFFYIDVFFVKQKTAYEMRISDWSSDVCSSDLLSQSKNRMPRKMSETGNRVVLITGGSRGIGFGTARVMGRGGWKVGISGTSEKALAAASARLAEDGIEHYAVAFRVEDADAWSGAVDAVEQALEIGRAACRERVCQYV